MSEYKCLESINSLYVEQTELGYNAIPCCAFANKHQNYVPNIEDLLDNPVMNEIREGFKGDWKRDECISCVHNEQIGKQSKRIRSLQRPADQITRWDLRPGNTCNLKCAMCNPWNSSKWYEDIDVFKKYRGNQVINEIQLKFDFIERLQGARSCVPTQDTGAFPYTKAYVFCATK